MRELWGLNAWCDLSSLHPGAPAVRYAL